MTGKPYNGFTAAQRNEAGRLQLAAFRHQPSLRATTCAACGLTEADGTEVHQHLEDYDEPITGIIGLDVRCHAIVHERDAFPEAAATYRRMIREGWTFPAARNYLGVIGDLRRDLPSRRMARPGPPRGRTVLDDIADGLLDPRQAAR